jgi:hypothetical protein
MQLVAQHQRPPAAPAPPPAAPPAPAPAPAPPPAAPAPEPDVPPPAALAPAPLAPPDVAPCVELVAFPAGLFDPFIELALLPAADPVGAADVCAKALLDASRAAATINENFFMGVSLV